MCESNTDYLIGKKVKAREWWSCDMCGKRIEVGELYDWQKIWQHGRHTWDGDWIDGHYKYFHMHNYDCITPVECQKGNHEYEFIEEKGDKNEQDEFIKMFYQKPGYFCKNCGEEKLSMEDLQEIDLENIKVTGYSHNG